MSRRAAASATVALLVALVPVGCSDGTPEFCGPLGETVDLDQVARALDDGELEVARAEARRFRDLAGEAPDAIRSDLVALAESVIDIVGLLADDASVADGTSRASDVERRRDELNERFGDLDRRSGRVTTWAARECGLDL